MSKKNIKSFSIILCAVLLINFISIGAAYALKDEGTPKSDTNRQNTLSKSEAQSPAAKDETVYVMTSPDGKVRKIIVSDWIKNSVGASSIKDKSDLTDIDNVKGDESYTVDENRMQIWDTQGNDIYYRGNIEKELPVNLILSYKLDGKSITADELAGKSGKVTIRFDYKNNQYQTVDIDGKKEKIYVPFAMLTGMILDTDKFDNVRISNGKIINDGDRIFALGIALPGLTENLGMDCDELSLPEYVEITADVKNFEMTNTVTVASNELFNKLDTDKIDSFDDLEEAMNAMQSAVNQLVDGSSQLYGGLCTLLDKSEELIEGINRLAKGAEKLREAYGAVVGGADSLNDASEKLSNGLGALAANSNSLREGSKEIFNSLLGAATEQLKSAGLNVPNLTVENYSETLNGVLNSLKPENVSKAAENQALQTVTQKVNEQKETIRSSVTDAVQSKVIEQVTFMTKKQVKMRVLAEAGLTEEQYEAGIASGMIDEAMQKKIEAAVEAQMQTKSVQEMIQSNVNVQMNSEAIKTTVDRETENQTEAIIEEKMKSAEIQSLISQAIEKANAGSMQIVSLLKQLNDVNKFCTGLNYYTDGVDKAGYASEQISKGASALKAGTIKFKSGLDELCNGIFELKDGSPALKEGISGLCEGSAQLSQGLKEFSEKGIENLVDFFNKDIKNIAVRVKATADVSKDYKNFSGISDDMDGKVKFIYRTDEINIK